MRVGPNGKLKQDFVMEWITEEGLPPLNQWPITSDYDSHRPLLLYAATRPEVKRIVELGVGYGSTPMLRSLINKDLLSVESDKEWAEKFGMFHCDDYSNLFLFPPDLMFVDSKPGEERKNLIERYRILTKVFVVHDTEPGAEYVYGMNKILSSFKYRYDYKPEGMPWTTAVSDEIDVTQWKV
jgi:hypothetical protein